MLSPFRRNLIVIFLCYGSVTLIACIAEVSASPYLKVAALAIIAGFQNHLQILQHEGAHYHVHADRKLNDRIVDISCSLPFLGSLKHYRYFHWQHHKHLLEPDLDPEVAFYKEQGYEFKERAAIRRFLSAVMDLSGINYLRFFISFQKYLYTEVEKESPLRLTPSELRRAVLVYLIFAVMIGMTGGRLLFYWFLPQATFLFFFLKLQGYGEHSLRTDKIETCTHAPRAGFIKKFFIYPLNSNLHLQHHLAPQLKWFELSSDIPLPMR